MADGQRRRISVTVLLALVTGVFPARAEDAAALLYPEVIVPTDMSFSDDPGLSALRRAAAEASNAKVDVGGAQVLDPSALLSFMAEEVEFFVGPGDGISRNAFRSLGFHPAGKALEMLGSLSRAGAGPDPLVRQRYAMYALQRILADPAVGRTPWLEGRVCTASYGQVKWPDWMALHAGPGMRDLEWVIVSALDREGMENDLHVPADWPKLHQLVPVAGEQKAAAGWLGIVAPTGGTVFFRDRFDTVSDFATYLNDHACFEERDGGWKITAIAKRLE